MYSTMIVARLDPADIGTVAKLFGDFDSGTELPHTMGTRRRQLFAYNGLYFHIQDFESDNGGRLIEQAKSDPRFVQIQKDLLPYIHVFDPETWRSPSDAMAQRFYTWQVAA
ncbi:TcmI family type II polyketide cyclase [Streptomyces aurantiacus]|nr:TcmI family type II polyketide cyclase [Streptomyces aurantiacus]